MVKMTMLLIAMNIAAVILSLLLIILKQDSNSVNDRLTDSSANIV